MFLFGWKEDRLGPNKFDWPAPVLRGKIHDNKGDSGAIPRYRAPQAWRMETFNGRRSQPLE